MRQSGSDAAALLAAAVAARTAGDIDGARAAYVRAFDAARAVDDSESMTQAALGLAAGQRFGTVPGRIPAFLHAAYTAAGGLARAKLGVAIARTWVYGGDPSRAVHFAEEAIAIAEAEADAAVLAEALDAQLLVSWGPDQLEERLAITSRLEDTVSHLPDPEARMSAYLWRLTTAMECLDLATMRRQLRSLDLVATESGSARIRFFAAARRGMYGLLTDDLDVVRQALVEADLAGAEAGEADHYAITRVLSSGIARQVPDLDALVAEAEAYEIFGIDEGVQSVVAEATGLWLEAGRIDRVAALLDVVVGPGLDAVPRDLDWLLTVTCVARAAAAVGDVDRCREVLAVLTPYAGRAVVNAGAVAFHGVVDHYLMLACEAIGDREAASAWRLSADAGYRAIGAAWWRSMLGTVDEPVDAVDDRVHLHPTAAGWWQVGRTSTTATMRDMKGLHYLRLLLRSPMVPIRAADLSDAAAGHPGQGVRQSDSELIDRTALAAYHRRLTELDIELAAEIERSGSERRARLEAEKDALLEQVRAATGLGGRLRHGTATDERARVAVRKAIAAALTKIGESNPGLARLIADTVTTGAACCYEPDPTRPVSWILDADVPSGA